MNTKSIISWVFRIIAAVILLQTLYFKFTAHPESVDLFTKLGVEPWGRVGTGIIELITGILLLRTSSAFIGGFLSFGLMTGAILSHLIVIGVETNHDGGTLFILAIVVFILSIGIQILHKDQGINLYNKFLKK